MCKSKARVETLRLDRDISTRIMLNSRTADINWSIGDFPNWELEHEGEDSDSPEPEEGLKSIAER